MKIHKVIKTFILAVIVILGTSSVTHAESPEYPITISPKKTEKHKTRKLVLGPHTARVPLKKGREKEQEKEQLINYLNLTGEKSTMLPPAFGEVFRRQFGTNSGFFRGLMMKLRDQNAQKYGNSWTAKVVHAKSQTAKRQGRESVSVAAPAAAGKSVGVHY